jgi:hypothetical protein
MELWIARCQSLYRRLAGAFPLEFRMVCGDGLDRLGEDIVPIVWREQGAAGLLRLFADIAIRLPFEYVATCLSRVKEITMTEDPFEGTWTANPEMSHWDPNYTPEQACLRFEPTQEGYLMVAYGVKDGKAVAERPTPIRPDGVRRPVVDLNGRPIPGVPPGAISIGSRPDRFTLEGHVEADGKRLGGGRYRVSDDGKTLTVTTEGMGIKGPFKVTAVFDRVVPDPYGPR